MTGSRASLQDTASIPPFPLPLPGPVFVLVTAAGSSTRFGGSKKELEHLEGKTVLQRSLNAFLQLRNLAGVAVTYPEGAREDLLSALDRGFRDRLETSLPCGLIFVKGGGTRQESVASGLAALAAAAVGKGIDPGRAIVLVHDAARPWVQAGLAEEVARAAGLKGACLPLCVLSDTPKQVDGRGTVTSHPERSAMMGAQTPQGFCLGALAAAHTLAARDGFLATDDSSVWDRYVGPVSYVEGDRSNRKITFAEDLRMPHENACSCRIGEGWDLHRLVEGRTLVLGGVRIPHDKGELGHSDGDALFHAVIDALLGAAGLGDIGAHFPPSDPAWKDAHSRDLASKIASLLESEGWSIVNVDATVVLERPRLGPHRLAIEEGIASALGIDAARVSVKAKTYEGLGEVGRGEAIEARAVALLERRKT